MPQYIGPNEGRNHCGSYHANPNGLTKPAMNGSQEKSLPCSPEAEEYLLSYCFLEGSEIVRRCIDKGIVPDSFHDPKRMIVFDCILSLHAKSMPIDLAVVAEELRSTGKLNEIGGYPFLIEVSGKMATTAQAPYFIDKVRELHLLRETIRRANFISDKCYSLTDGIGDFLETVKQTFSNIGNIGPVAKARGIFSFEVPKPGDPSILLGNRYLVRGDGGFLVSTSGMGKSSMSLQMAVHWALGISAFGIPSNGKLRSLFIQAEDSEGDIGEVVASIASRLNLTGEQITDINSKVVIHTMKTRKNFLTQLRSLVEIHKPDIVWINPLQSFMDGDIKDSSDLGNFLRDGLSSVNAEGKFAYMIVHHTTKPPQEKAERAWNEVMYDMAGGAEIINWARCIMSLRASKEEGKFNLVLAKRGRRAGVTRKVDQGAGTRSEIVTTIPLRHSDQTCVANGITIPMIYWEVDEENEGQKKPANGPRRTVSLNFSEVKSAIPVGLERAMNYAQIHRVLSGKKKVSQTVIADALMEWASDGMIKTDQSDPNTPRYYL